MLAWLAASLLSIAPPEPPELPELPEPGMPEADPVDLVPEPVAEPTPEPAVAPAPEPAPAPGVVPDPAELDPAPAFAVGHGMPPGWVEVDRPTFRGTGLIAGAGVALGFGIAFQIGDRVLCGGCGPGIVDRIAFAHAFAFAAGAGIQRARADAFDDAVIKRHRDTRKARLAGAVLLGLGLAIGVVNEGLWWASVGDNEGPYAERDYESSLAISRAVLDVATIAGSTGVGLLTWQARYRRDRAAYRNARVLSLAPSFGETFAGATVQGTF
jgi:hypothetical protein